MKPKNSYLRDARQGVGIGARLSNQQAQGHSHLLRRAVIVLFCLIFFGNWCASLCFQGAWLYIFIHPSASKEKQQNLSLGMLHPKRAQENSSISSPQSDHCGKGKRSFWTYKGQRDAKSQEAPEGSRQETQGDEDL